MPSFQPARNKHKHNAPKWRFVFVNKPFSEVAGPRSSRGSAVTPDNLLGGSRVVSCIESNPVPSPGPFRVLVAGTVTVSTADEAIERRK